MNPTEFWWVRHAPVIGFKGRRYGALDPDCDVSDVAAFRALRDLLPPRAVMVTSALRRARRTAEAIVDAGLECLATETEPDLGEQSFGEWQGKTHREVERATREAGARHPHWVVAPEHTPPGGESFHAMAERVMAASRRVGERHAGREVVVVSHGGPIRAACAEADQWTLERALQLRIPHLSVTRMTSGPSWTLHFAGRTGTS